ncbi:hypothetical protein GCM10010271_58610 [Streptomyces kurssanovii]|nr:hypothetical protein GCM10010271_58610 [Streptomyces kurssanovii]
MSNAAHATALRNRKHFALRAQGLVPWTAIGDTPLGCVIICTHHSRPRECAGGVA